jgi:glycosyltransferase involved in cell wall biosynthesis
VKEPLRILMVSGVPWRRELGAARGQIELAEELRQLGHVVEKFDYQDAFGDAREERWHRLFPKRFARRARAYVRQHAHEFDVIEALHGDLPFGKRELGFEGLLVARSMGLHALYEEFIRYERKTWPDRLPGTVFGKTLHRFNVRRRSVACRRSLQLADLVRVLNRDEEAYVVEKLKLGHKCVALPDGLTDRFAEALARAALPPAVRLQRREVAFVGFWSLRKGAADWAEIISRTRGLVPAVKFRFLGTGRERADVLDDLGLQHDESVSVVPHFDADQLPSLLAGATVGTLPSYIEGCPFSILEQLAAGLPTIAYDVPGSRVMLGRFSRPLMTPPGDVSRFAKLLAEILTLEEGPYTRLSAECVAVANEFRCSDIARASLEAYAKARRGSDGLSNLSESTSVQRLTRNLEHP